MAKKKKDLSEELIDLKADEESAQGFNSEEFDLDLSEVESADPPPHPSELNENTIRLVPAQNTNAKTKPQLDTPSSQDVKVSYGLPRRKQVPRAQEEAVPLRQSEHLRMAQNKINDLEEDIIKLRQENEELATAGETFKKLNDEYYATIETIKAKLSDQKLTYGQEIKLLKQINQNKDRQISELRQQLEDYKAKIDNNFQRVRQREKDLEHRLEIARIEEAAVVKSKDQLILDLKRRIDELSQESDNFRKKSQENYLDLQKKQQVVRGAVRAMRIALTKLEGEDDSDYGLSNLEDSDES